MAEDLSALDRYPWCGHSVLVLFCQQRTGDEHFSLAETLKFGQPAISRSVQRGEKIAENENLIDHLE